MFFEKMEERKEALTTTKKFTSTYIFCTEKYFSLTSHENVTGVKRKMKKKKNCLEGKKYHGQII